MLLFLGIFDASCMLLLIDDDLCLDEFLALKKVSESPLPLLLSGAGF